MVSGSAEGIWNPTFLMYNALPTTNPLLNPHRVDVDFTGRVMVYKNFRIEKQSSLATVYLIWNIYTVGRVNEAAALVTLSKSLGTRPFPGLIRLGSVDFFVK